MQGERCGKHPVLVGLSHAPLASDSSQPSTTPVARNQTAISLQQPCCLLLIQTHRVGPDHATHCTTHMSRMACYAIA